MSLLSPLVCADSILSGNLSSGMPPTETLSPDMLLTVYKAQSNQL